MYVGTGLPCGVGSKRLTDSCLPCNFQLTHQLIVKVKRWWSLTDDDGPM